MTKKSKKLDIDKLENWRKDRSLRIVWCVSSVFVGLLASLACSLAQYVCFSGKYFYEAADPALPFFLHWKFLLMTFLWICGAMLIPVLGIKLHVFLYRRFVPAAKKDQEPQGDSTKDA